ncbi:hypothetical protein A4G19_12760 [Pasteurellaceae bacterium Macca]|nr:hypothetical protein [Pasteurellaceae bacterium Macca]
MHKDKDDLRTRLLMNLAKHNPKIVAIEWVDNAMQGKNIYPELVSIRNKQFTVAEVLEKKPQPLDLSQKEVKQKEIATAFLKWSKRPLRRDVRVAKTYAYNGLYWEEINEEEISRLVMAFFDEHNGDYSISKIKKMAELAMLKMQPIPSTNADYLGLRNGVINKKTGEFLPHQADHYLRGIDDFECKPTELATPYFDDWIAFISNGNEESAKRF